MNLAIYNQSLFDRLAVSEADSSDVALLWIHIDDGLLTASLP